MSFWSGGLKIKKAGLTEGSTIGFKYLIGSDWNRPNGSKADETTDRNFKVPMGFKDTTLTWVYFNNDRPQARANPDTVKMTFIANLAQAASSGGFNVTTDTLYVRTGYFSTSNESGRSKQMLRLSGTIFQVVDTVITAKNKMLDYQYYTVRNGQDVRENYYNFYYTGPVASEAERRQILIDSISLEDKRHDRTRHSDKHHPGTAPAGILKRPPACQERQREVGSRPASGILPGAPRWRLAVGYPGYVYHPCGGQRLHHEVGSLDERSGSRWLE